jgi:hypothetical protein
MEDLDKKLETTKPFPVTAWDRIESKKVSDKPDRYVPG